MNEYLDVHKIVKLVDTKIKLDAKSAAMKLELLDSINQSEYYSAAFNFKKNEKGELCFSIPIYDINLTFIEKLVVINGTPLIQFTATSADEENHDEIFYINKNGSVSLGEYNPKSGHEYNDRNLFLEITDYLIASLNKKEKISY
ncbi:hypothetical protein [Atlantibacter hermannii]|uniref:hypothetical protein n=1 Tax=Atlantibacter hermannii TaxID=565 RepID=UPI0028A873AD|nr:hypothetical protein [Atlantibacter hermannii]